MYLLPYPSTFFDVFKLKSNHARVLGPDDLGWLTPSLFFDVFKLKSNHARVLGTDDLG